MSKKWPEKLLEKAFNEPNSTFRHFNETPDEVFYLLYRLPLFSLNGVLRRKLVVGLQVALQNVTRFKKICINYLWVEIICKDFPVEPI